MDYRTTSKYGTIGLDYNDGFIELTETDKSGNPIVNYVYKLTNIQAAHTLRITIGGATVQLYVKENGSWRTYSKVYKKINGAWVEQADISSVFNTGANYVKMN